MDARWTLVRADHLSACCFQQPFPNTTIISRTASNQLASHVRGKKARESKLFSVCEGEGSPLKT